MQSTKSRNGPSSSPSHNKNTKNRGSKSTASPRNPMSEKKQASKVSEMESQLVQLQEELKRAKDQVSSLEAQKKRAQQEAEETKKQASSLSAKLEECQQQLIELSESDEARLHELRKISQERDRSWQSELESLQKQHAADSVALSSAMNEVQRLKKQLDVAAESAHEEVQSLRVELSEALDLVAELKHQMKDAKESEARGLERLSDTQRELKAAIEAVEAIRSDSLEAKEGYNTLASELEQSKAQVNTLEMLVTQLKQDLSKKATDDHQVEEADKLNKEIDSLKLEAGQLKSALEASEARYQNEYIQSTLQIRSAYEAMERAKLESSLKEAALVEELKKAKEAVEELSVKIDENQASEKDIRELKSALLDKETQLQTLEEENEMLRTEIGDNVNEEAVVDHVVSLRDEEDKSSQRARKFAEQLYVTQVANAELEAELRMLKVQADQWRKAAEAAAAMLSPDCDAKAVDRTVSVETIGMKMDSPFSDTMDDDSPKKKNAKMLKKIGGLWKKGQK